MSKKAVLGAEGESLAVEYLQSIGYEIQHKNYRYKLAEIDIIAKHEQLLIFVEVKTRTKTDFGFPEEAVDEKKAAKVGEGAEHYTFENNWNGDIRFDIISVVLGDATEIEHFKDAFN